MTERARSPKRVRILASINPLDDQDDPLPPSRDPEIPRAPKPADANNHEPRPPRATKFRFKSHYRSHHRSPRDDDSHHSHHSHSRRRRRHHHRSRSASPRPQPPPDTHATTPPLSPNTAFRESLFDALADDEGAAYWEGVYGQPVHTYARPDTTTTPASTAEGDVVLEQMTDDEYAAYVRRRMWEKTHAGLLEERARREAVRETREREAAEERRVAREVERSLRRGEERRRRNWWVGRWGEYVGGWEGWDGGVEGVPWPVESGRRGDVGEEGAVRAFFVKGLDLEGLGERGFAARLKEERVRWHPDKMQQRLGGQVDEGVMRDVTAIFQIIDSLWGDTRGKA